MTQLVNAFANVIINPILALLFAGGVLVFVFGVVEYLYNFNIKQDESARESGMRHMLWGLIGMFVMAAAVAIINVIANTVNGLTH
jgi:hypothetical protein